MAFTPKPVLVTKNWFIAQEAFTSIFHKQITKEKEALHAFIYKNAHVNNNHASLFCKEIQINLSGLRLKPKDYTRVHFTLVDELHKLTTKRKYTEAQRHKVLTYLSYAAMFKEGEIYTGFESWISSYIPTSFKSDMQFDTETALHISLDYADEVSYCKETIIWEMFE